MLLELVKYLCVVVMVVGLMMGGMVVFYMYLIYMQKFFVNMVGLLKDMVMLVFGVMLLLFVMLQLIVGGLFDCIGCCLILIVFGVLGMLFIVLIMIGISQIINVWMVFFFIMVVLVIVFGYMLINVVVKVELFFVEVCVLGVGLLYVFMVLIFGGMVEYIVLWFKQVGYELLFYWYVMGMIFLLLLVYVFMCDICEYFCIEY